MTDEDFVYSRIGMALVSAQRVEFATGQILKHLTEFSDIYCITTNEFFSRSSKSRKAVKTLGSIFRLLKLNPKWVIEDELDKFLQKRNFFVHNFWNTYLHTTSTEQIQIAINICNDFGRSSQVFESFFKGFLYFLALRHVKDRDLLG